MLRTGFKIFAVITIVGVMYAQQAQAGWRHHWRWGSSGGSWGSCGSSGGSWGSSGGSWGSSGGSWGSSGGSWGSSGGSWGSSGGSWGSSGGSSGGYHHHHPVQPAQPAQPATPPTPPSPSDAAPSTTYHPTYGPMRNSALLSVKVPADAKVFVNDQPTTSTGVDREYISRDLRSGARYSYHVRAEFVRDGKPVTDEKTIRLTAGQTASLNFTDGEKQVRSADSDDTRTTLKVRLPADAKLYLAGHETKATGEVREFSTTKLPAGSQWATYDVRAVVNRDGHEEVREQTVSLAAGQSREISISFDAPQVADKVADASAR